MVNLPLEGFFTEEVSLAQRPDILVLWTIWLFYRNAYLSSAYDEKCVSPCSLSDYVVSIVVECLQKKIPYIIYSQNILDFFNNNRIIKFLSLPLLKRLKF